MPEAASVRGLLAVLARWGSAGLSCMLVSRRTGWDSTPEGGDAWLLSTRLKTIDADAHVVESERTWDFLEPSEEKYRPRLFFTPDDHIKRYWVVEDRIAGLRLPNLSDYDLQQFSEVAGRNVVTPQAAREMDDVGLRLKHMDELGIDIQVLHNTLWIEQVTTKPAVDVALCGSWNRWLAHIWKQGKGRLRWSCLVPTTSLPDAIDQMRFAKENGAVAVCMRPIEGNRSLTDAYFYPIYEEAAKLDMAIAIHIANGNPANCELHRGFPEGLTARSFRHVPRTHGGGLPHPVAEPHARGLPHPALGLHRGLV